jgi:hypothetical protein
LAALALERGGHVAGLPAGGGHALAARARRHVTAVHTVGAHVEAVRVATAFGCAAALAYLAAYAAPGFGAQCPAATGGHQATTMCVTSATPCDVERAILIAEPCAAAYMNEASNSWVLLGVSDAPIDPYGSCH